MIFVDPFDSLSAFYPLVAYFKANRCVIRVKIMQKSERHFSSGQTLFI